MKDLEKTATAPELAARCHEIQTGLETTAVPEFDHLLLIGMAVRIALHIRGLPAIPFEILKLVGYQYLNIPTLAAASVVTLLADVEFVKIGMHGKTIKTVVPNVPYYEDLYQALGEYGSGLGFNEAEQLSIELVQRLSRSPEKLDVLRNELGAEEKLLKRVIRVGEEGAYLRNIRARGRDILLTPTYFSENEDVFADAVAAGHAKSIQKIMCALKKGQGYPFAVIEAKRELGGIQFSVEEIRLMGRLAQDGAIKPPCITTPHAGENYFLFTPTPSGAALAATKRDIYEKAMAIVAAVRQGQLLPRQYAIREPGAVLYTLRNDLKLKRATTEAGHQYRNLVHLRVAQLHDAGHGYKQLCIIDTEENREALDIAYDLVNAGVASGIEVDEDARRALQQDQVHIESLVASGKLQKTKKMPIAEYQQQQLDFLFLR